LKFQGDADYVKQLVSLRQADGSFAVQMHFITKEGKNTTKSKLTLSQCRITQNFDENNIEMSCLITNKSFHKYFDSNFVQF
tara:strand:+ start:408 stop:650 length:243 start_codon:yes stop_codon:yes gene_type:complete